MLQNQRFCYFCEVVSSLQIMKHYRLPLIAAVLAFLLSSCGETPEPEKVTVSASPSSISFTMDGGTATVSVTSNGAWSVQVGGSWIKLSDYAGNGNASLTVTAAANDGEARTGSLSFRAADGTAEVSLSQEAHQATVKSLKEIRALYQGSDYKITEDVVMDAVVISDFRRNTDGGLNNYSSAKTIVVSDGQAGLQLYCTEENKTFARGDKVRVHLLNQTLHVYNHGSMEVSNLPLANIEKTGTETPVAREITLDELLSGDYESMYVAVKDVQVKEEFLGSTFVKKNDKGEALNTSIGFEGKDGRDFDLFTSKYAVFGTETVPTGSGTLKGIAGKYAARTQVTISEKGDFAGLTGERFSTGAHFSLSFTDFYAWGDAGSFDVGLTSDVEWTAGSSDPDFTLSPDHGTEGCTVRVSFTDNPSTTDTRSATITFKTNSSQVPAKGLVLTVTQQPYEVLTQSQVQPWLEIPAMTAADNRAFIAHDMAWGGARVRNYAFWLDLDNRVSLWVAYPLYEGMTKGVDRTDKWSFDPLVPRRYQAETSGSYSGTGYDRGHQLPSADRLCTTEANESTFYYTNITPQNRELNAGIWEDLESHIRGQMSVADTLYVVTGCVVTTKEDPNIQYIRDNAGKDVAIPKAYYKVILKYKAGAANGGYSAIGFWMENRSYGSAAFTRGFAKTVDEIEKLTGFDFFVNLNDEYEKEAESKYDASAWGL